MAEAGTTSAHAGDAWVSARHLQHFVAHAEALGYDPETMLSEAGLSRPRLADADGRIPIRMIEAMLTALAAGYDTRLVGLELASDIQPATFGPLGHLAQACRTFGDVLDTLGRFDGLLSNIGATAMVRAPGTIAVQWRCLAGGEAFRRQATEYVLGAFVVLARFLLPQRRDLLHAIHFSHAGPCNTRHRRAYFEFFRAPVYFNAKASAIVMPARVLDAPMQHGDAQLKELLEQHAAELLRQNRKQVALPAEVHHLLAAMTIDGVPTREGVAAQLGMSGRTLHRKLEAAGSSYRQILDAVRLDMATQHLCEHRLGVSATAAALGFSSHQAFLRWFKRTTGQTPTQYRGERGERC